MSLAAILSLIMTLLTASKDIMANVEQLMALFKRMKDENREDMTPEEIAQMTAVRDMARAALARAISKAP